MSVPGIYSVSLNTYGVMSTAYDAKLNLVLNKANGSGEKVIGAAHAQTVKYGAGSFRTMVEMDVGDELYPKGEVNGKAYASNAYSFLAFEAHLLYRAKGLN